MAARTTEEPDTTRNARADLVNYLVHSGALVTPRVIDAFRSVPRHLFVPPREVYLAYEDHPLPIGFGQTISQPTVIAMMTEALELAGQERVLEIGAGSGYQAAILSLLCREVFSIERVAPLAAVAEATLRRLGYSAHVRAGDGYQGWPEDAPFDRILLTAAPDEMPRPLVSQLVDGGIMVAPIGGNAMTQELLVVRKRGTDLDVSSLGGVRFVPMLPGVTTT